MSPAESAVRDIYFHAQQNLNMMLLACRTDEERSTIRLQYSLARHNFVACTNKAFQNDDPALVDLVTKANAAAEELKNIEKQLGDITKVLNAMTEGVDYGSQILTHVIAA